MVKAYNCTSGKSDRHQEHLRKQGWQDVQRIPTLLDWYEKITTPKPKKEPKVKPVKTRKPLKGVRDGRVYNVLPARCNMRLAQYKRDTHWVARSEEEYNNMHHIEDSYPELFPKPVNEQ